MPKVCNADFERRVLGSSPKTSHAETTGGHGCPLSVNVLRIGTSQSKKYMNKPRTLNPPGSLGAAPLNSAGERGGYRGRENPALDGVLSPPKLRSFL